MKLLRPKEAAEMLGVSTCTIRAMDKRGELHPIRTSGNQRRFLDDEIKELMGVRGKRVVAIYGRVSSHDQKKDLVRQLGRLRQKYPSAEEYKDIRSGMKFDRRGFYLLLEAVQGERISVVVITHRDRLARFGFDLLEKVFAFHGTRIEVLDEDKKSSAQEELAKDLITIVTSFSARLYGLRSHKTKRMVRCVREEVRSPED